MLAPFIVFGQFQTFKLCKEMLLNAANIYLFGIKRIKCKYIDTSLLLQQQNSTATKKKSKKNHKNTAATTKYYNYSLKMELLPQIS